MKKRNLIISILFVFFIAVAGMGYYFIWLSKANTAVSSQEIVLEEGQDLLYAKITSISGNEMNYTVLEERTADLEATGDVQNRPVTTYTETGTAGQIQIPVGTDVETKLGTITTFSRLSNGDTIRMLMQKADTGSEELLKIWIVD